MRLAAALLLALIPATAAASGLVESEPQRKKFGSRSACEKALQREHANAVARLAAMPAEERRSSRVEPLRRDDDGHLLYSGFLDLTITMPKTIMTRSRTDELTCRGKVLEHRTYLEAPSYYFPPPPPDAPKQ